MDPSHPFLSSPVLNDEMGDTGAPTQYKNNIVNLQSNMNKETYEEGTKRTE